MLCRVVPYEGNEPYIFLSYCHKDQARLYPLFEQMVKDGYRVWYDDGNHAGDDWPSKIEDAANRATVFVAFFSEASSLSNNCKAEVTYAMKKNKLVIPILIGTEDLPKGMRMLLSYLHYLKAADYSSDRILLNKLYESEALVPCKGPGGELRPANTGGSSSQGNNNSAVDDNSESKKEVPPQNDPQVRKKVVRLVVKKPKPPVDSTNSADTKKDEQQNQDGTVWRKPDGGGSEGANADTVFERFQDVALLVHPFGRRVTRLNGSQTKLGRSALKCDVVIEGNDSISKYHADIIHNGKDWYLRDAGSLNGTYLNDRRLEADQSVRLGSNATVFQMDNMYLALITDELAWEVMANKYIPALINEKTSAIQILNSDSLLLNRNNVWSDGTFSDPTVHRAAHAKIMRTDKGFYLINESAKNVTCHNEVELQQGESRELNSGDTIRLGDTTTVKFVKINVQGDE